MSTTPPYHPYAPHPQLTRVKSQPRSHNGIYPSVATKPLKGLYAPRTYANRQLKTIAEEAADNWQEWMKLNDGKAYTYQPRRALSDFSKMEVSCAAVVVVVIDYRRPPRPTSSSSSAAAAATTRRTGRACQRCRMR